jgi:hypothetical protein
MSIVFFLVWLLISYHAQILECQQVYIYAINIVFCKIYLLGRLFVYFLCQLDLHKFFNQI